MSLWPETLQIGFSTERVVCLRVQQRLRSQVTQKAILEIDAPLSARPWLEPLRALNDYLPNSGSKRARARVVLSNRFVRYVVLPWHDAVISRKERMAQARHYFKQIYGDGADAWSVSCSAPRYGQPTLATAVDAALIEALRDVLTKNAFGVRTIQPYLTAAFGCFHQSLSLRTQRLQLFCVVEPSYISCLELQDGAPRSVFNQRVGGDWRNELEAIFLQAGGHSSLTDKASVSVFAPDGMVSASEPRVDGIKRLLARFPAGLSPATDGRYAMALMANA